MKLPLFFIVGVRSYYAHQQGMTADTCPVFAEPILRAWQIPYVLLDQRHNAGDLENAYRQSQAEGRAGAALAPAASWQARQAARTAAPRSSAAACSA